MKRVKLAVAVICVSLVSETMLGIPNIKQSRDDVVWLTQPAEAAVSTGTRNKALSLYKQGAAYNKKKNYTKALTLLSASCKLVNTSADTYYQLGISYEGLKKYVLAGRNYRQAVRLNPKHKAAVASAKSIEVGPKAVVLSSNY